MNPDELNLSATLVPPLEITPVLGIGEAILFFILTWTFLGFALSRVLGRNDIADLLWGSGITILTVLIGFLTGDGALNLAQWFVLSLVTTWGLRLTFYLAIRNLPEPEDSRYAAWRKEWGPKEPLIALLRVFLLQTGLAVLVGAAAWGKLQVRVPQLAPSVWDGMAICVALIGLLIETVADLQLYLFRARRRAAGATGHGVLKTGLWAWSRHPNYFGETVFWWGIAGIGLFNHGLLAALLSLGGAAFITFFLLRVSGVTMTDRGMKARRPDPEYQDYIDQTPAFLPFPPGLRKLQAGDQP